MTTFGRYLIMFSKKEKYPTVPVKFKDVAKILGIARSTLHQFIADLGVELPRSPGGKRRLPTDVANKIIGASSNPPHKIDKYEYHYTLGTAAKILRWSSRYLRNFLTDTNWHRCCYKTATGRIKIPRSVVLKIGGLPNKTAREILMEMEEED